MNQAIDCFHQISQSIKKNCKDSSLITNLQKSLFTLLPEQIDPQIYSRLMLSIYDLSNHYTLISSQGAQSHNLGIRLKLISMKMICILIQLMMNVKNGISRLDKQIEIEALQIMILSIRLCIDSQVDCLQQVIENQKFCTQIFSYYCPYDSNLDEKQLMMQKNCIISQDILILYYLNKLDLLRIIINTSSFQILELENCLKSVNGILQFSANVQNDHKQIYAEYISNIMTEITLKLLRQGSSECFEKFKSYLPQTIKNTLNKFMEGDLPLNSEVHIGQVYQLYWHICTNGMQSINTESLEKFMAKDEIFEGSEIFQAILLTNQPALLQMWFNQNNKRLSKPPNIIQAYECFMFLVTSYLNRDKIKESGLKLQTHQQSQQKLQNYLKDLVSLCKQILLNLLRLNKDSQLPIVMVANFIQKLLLNLVINLYKYEICCQIFENFYMVCNKHSLHDIHKSINAIHLYYDLLNKVQNQQTYKKFIKINGNDKNQTFKLLKICYQIQKGNTNIDQNTVNLVKKKPQFALLFCEPKDRAMLILNMDIKNLSQIQNIFEIYSILLQQYINEQNILQKIAINIQNVLLLTQYSKLSINYNSCIKMKQILKKLINKNNKIYIILFLYLYCFCLEFQKIVHQSYGIVFNKYSKLLKMIDFITIDSQIICILKIIICKTCQNFKQSLKSKGKCSPEAGEIIFIKIIYQIIQKWNEIKNIHNKQNSINSKLFVKFSLFEIYCINNRNQQLQQMIDQQQNIKLQQLYVNSNYIKKKYKLILLRKLFKSNILNNTQITLNDMKDLIQLAETPQEFYIYITSTIQLFGEKGKKIINLLAQGNQKIAQMCLQINSKDSQGVI